MERRQHLGDERTARHGRSRPEILDAWLSVTEIDPTEANNIAKLKAWDEQR
jgi:hypothetical protein